MTEENCTKNEIEEMPCPICGGKVEAEKVSEEETDYWCTKCDAWCGSCFNDVCTRVKSRNSTNPGEIVEKGHCS